jgi:hypothetical protein
MQLLLPLDIKISGSLILGLQDLHTGHQGSQAFGLGLSDIISLPAAEVFRLGQASLGLQFVGGHQVTSQLHNCMNYFP